MINNSSYWPTVHNIGEGRESVLQVKIWWKRVAVKGKTKDNVIVNFKVGICKHNLPAQALSHVRKAVQISAFILASIM